MSRWPWVTTVAALVLFLNPIAFEIVPAAFRYAPTDWLRDLWVAVTLGAVVLVSAAGLVEFAIRRHLARKRSWRAAGRPPDANGTGAVNG